MVNGDDPRPGTAAAVERRVERLDERFGALEARMAAVELNQTHYAKIVELQFETIKQTLATTLARLDAFIGKIETDREAGMAASSDPEKTAAGRQIVTSIVEVKTEIGGLSTRVSGVERKQWIMVGAISVVIAVANIVGPIIVNGLFPGVR